MPASKIITPKNKFKTEKYNNDKISKMITLKINVKSRKEFIANDKILKIITPINQC